MKNTKRVLAFLVGAAMMLPMASAEGKLASGNYEATSQGFGGAVTVKVTVTDGKVTAATITGDKETETIGGTAIKTLTEKLIGVSSADEVDAVASATVTSNAVKTALADCLRQAAGEEKTETALVDGVYTGEERGFNLTQKVQVTVEIKDGKIASVTVGDNGETMGMIAAVEEKWIPRVVENQSLAVDAICGATASSNGVRAAVVNALESAGMDVSGMYKAIPKVNAAEEYNVDIVVVGMGSSGTTAALAAAESGANVLAIDKAGKWGGTGVTTSGPANVNAPSQVASEIVDWKDPINGVHTKAAGEQLVDADALYATWTDYTTVDGAQGAKPELIAKVIYESGETCDWLQSYGFEFTPAVGFVGGKWAIFSSYVGQKQLTESFFAKAYDRYTEMGGQYLLETEATELIMQDGKAVGVRAIKADGTSVTINAKAVILCTGGFAGSDEMQEKYIGQAYKLFGMSTNDGKMIESAIENGAATRAIGMYPMSHFVAPTVITTQFSAEDNDIPYGLVCTAEGMAVNMKGERFINESAIAMNAFYQGNHFYYVYSKEQIDILRAQGLSANASGRYLTQGGIKADVPLTNIDTVIDAGIEAGFIYKASSLDELAAQIGGDFSADALKASVAGYNPENDAFGKDASKFERLGTVAADSEYYVAFTGAPYIYSTCGGLDVNENLQVLDTNGNVIPGLFACGTDSMGVLFNEDKAYTNYGGCAQSYCFVSGRDAGAYAAAHLED